MSCGCGKSKNTLRSRNRLSERKLTLSPLTKLRIKRLLEKRLMETKQWKRKWRKGDRNKFKRIDYLEFDREINPTYNPSKNDIDIENILPDIIEELVMLGYDIPDNINKMTNDVYETLGETNGVYTFTLGNYEIVYSKFSKPFIEYIREKEIEYIVNDLSDESPYGYLAVIQ